ncbi:hypothetical protein [Hydrogenophaga sp.]|uniref:hypothetical protein n=1 Tax=Hydrogenophaga sp. TaxID=1904254 RepID=UPI0019C8F48C|nr:hypothetical protein [Hydrogenophaga sp.]MBD3892584.1 hypothetical protein [Hydrogenophaga sp.]
MRTHQHLDARSLALHREIAAKLRRDRALFARARATLRRWRSTVSPASQPYLMEWERLMDRGLEATLAVALDDSEHAAALRQSSPFTAVLTPRERFAFLKAWNQSQGSA